MAVAAAREHRKALKELRDQFRFLTNDAHPLDLSAEALRPGVTEFRREGYPG